MPETLGLDAITAIRGEFPEARIIVLTTYSGDVQVLLALKAGARAYLIKDVLDKELLDTIRTVHAGGESASAGISIKLAEHGTDELLTPRGSPGFILDCRRQGEQRNSRSNFDERSHGQGSNPQYPCQARRAGPHARSHDRLETRNYPPLTFNPK
jgi:DNA-binding response OmpR family regulator